MFREKPYRPDDAYFIKGVCAKTSDTHGVGVFATQDIKKNEIFEVSPVLLYSPAVFVAFMEETEVRHVLENYVFFWEHGTLATAWGMASLYNHSNAEANASYRLRKTDAPAIEIYSSRDIKKGEEVCLHYMHHQFDLEFGPNGEWWNAEESDMTSAIAGYDDSAAKFMSTYKSKAKYR